MAGRVENININILQQCRTQIGMEISEVEKKVVKIAEIEQGTRKPTFKQLDTLSQLYRVPRWVFISDKLPVKYVFDKAVPVFRQFAHNNADVFSNSSVRSITAQVERFRELVLELLNDMGEEITSFNPPELSSRTNPEFVANLICDWLKISERRLNFLEWKELLEEKGVFVFMTSKYRGWSHVDRILLRGLTIYHSTLPIIIINDSDAKKAQSFTLLHELGHLLRKESSIDNWEYRQQQVEKWCDELAGNVLMPSSLFRSEAEDIDDLNSVKNIAMNFKVSSYACLVRLRQLNIIDQNLYEDFEAQLIDEYAKFQKKMKESSGGMSRNRPREILNQYGHIFTKVVFQAYYNQEIGFHRLSQFFGLKNPSYILEMEGQL